MAEQVYESSASKYTVAVTFQWGTSHVTRYARWDNDLEHGGNTYLAEPSLEVRTGPQSGGVKDVPFTLTMSIRSPIDKMIRPYVHAEVTATIVEFDPAAADAARVVFKGRVSKIVRNKSGQKNLVQVEISGWRSLLQYPLGLPANTNCISALGDKNCCIDIGEVTQTATVVAITGLVNLEASSLTVPGGDEHYFTSGYVEFDGLRIKIKDGSAAPNLVLLEPPPPEWVGQTAAFVPGCDGRFLTCRNRWGNEQRFLGLGIVIPSYHPMLGSPK